MVDTIRIETVEAGSKVRITITTNDEDSDERSVSVSAWPVRVGASSGMNWKSFKAARPRQHSASYLRAHTK